ncbi:alkaline-phosphatase-like protein [Baffinella frigidus]|nr:alkaline-phosphatase-like protein [Cryptophyta sp. CCMP2293]
MVQCAVLVSVFAVGLIVLLGPLAAVAPAPEDMCAGGEVEGGSLRRISREAYEYWANLHPKAKGSIIMHTVARGVFRRQSGNRSATLALDAFLVGTSITSSQSNVITDSAAGATAYASGRKTYNGGVGVRARGANAASEESDDVREEEGVAGDAFADAVACDTACRTRGMATGMVVEDTTRALLSGVQSAGDGDGDGGDNGGLRRSACRARGMATGMVVTTVLPHATPAAFSSHAAYRYMYDFIAQQQIEADPPLDVMLGGGRRYFDSRRADGRDLLKEHADRFLLVDSREALAAATEGEGGGSWGDGRALLGLFADGDMHYEIDRVNKDQGRSRIDHALHANDAASAALDALAYDRAFAKAVKETERDPSLLVTSVADHSTGGITAGFQADFTVRYSQDVCEKGDACKASVGASAYGNGDGWEAQALLNASESIQVSLKWRTGECSPELALGSPWAAS